MAKIVATIARRQRAFKQSATNVNLVSTSFQIWNNVNGIAVTTFQYIILYKLVLVSWVFVMKCWDLVRCPFLFFFHYSMITLLPLRYTFRINRAEIWLLVNWLIFILNSCVMTYCINERKSLALYCPYPKFN